MFILHLIDLATRLTKACVIRSKLRETIIDAVMMKLADGPGASKTFLTDNGKEFTNQGFQEMCKLLNLRDFRTAVEILGRITCAKETMQ